MTVGNIVGDERFKPQNRATRLIAVLPETEGTVH